MKYSLSFYPPNFEKNDAVFRHTGQIMMMHTIPVMLMGKIICVKTGFMYAIDIRNGPINRSM